MTRFSQPATIVIQDWQPYPKNALQAFFTAILPSGLVLHKCTYFVRGKKRWVGLPAQQYTQPDGSAGYFQLVEFIDRATADKFQSAILPAIDQYLEKQKEVQNV